MAPAFNVPEFFLLTEEDFLPTESIKTRDQMSDDEYQATLHAAGCYDLDDNGKSFYDEE